MYPSIRTKDLESFRHKGIRTISIMKTLQMLHEAITPRQVVAHGIQVRDCSEFWTRKPCERVERQSVGSAEEEYQNW